MSGDPNQTSTKLRQKAIEIIRNSDRPLASHEIETWVRENDPELAELIQKKCSDYVRIILSVTQDVKIVKFKSLGPIPGVDKRSTFYGLSEKDYNKSEWSLITGKQTKTRKQQDPQQGKAKTTLKTVKEKQINISFPQFESFQVPLIDDFIPMGSIFDEIPFTTPSLMINEWDDILFAQY